MVNPVAIFSFGGNVIHVWSPSAVGSAASVIAITGPAAPSLPRIVTPGG
jgi:hypothetical protein